MTKREARLIRQVKKSCTYRRLAEIYYETKDNEYGMQWAGEDLCINAFKRLYPLLGHPFKINIEKQSEQFKEDNKSFLGNFYWWE